MLSEPLSRGCLRFPPASCLRIILYVSFHLLQVAALLFALMAPLFLLDVSRCQEQTGGGLRFPNLFGGLNNPFSLSNLFRQQRQPPNQAPLPPPLPSQNSQFALIGGQLSPVGGGNGQQHQGPNHFLQAPPPAFQQPTGQQPVPSSFNAFAPPNTQQGTYLHYRRRFPFLKVKEIKKKKKKKK